MVRFFFSYTKEMIIGGEEETPPSIFLLLFFQIPLLTLLRFDLHVRQETAIRRFDTGLPAPEEFEELQSFQVFLSPELTR